MDFTNIMCISQQCKGKNQKMDGAGGTFSPNLTLVGVKCPVCGLKLMIVPMDDNFRYEVEKIDRNEKKKDTPKVQCTPETCRHGY